MRTLVSGALGDLQLGYVLGQSMRWEFHGLMAMVTGMAFGLTGLSGAVAVGVAAGSILAAALYVMFLMRGYHWVHGPGAQSPRIVLKVSGIAIALCLGALVEFLGAYYWGLCLQEFLTTAWS